MGIIKPYEALDYGISGPNARASGIDWDLRREVGYSVYPEFDFKVPLGQHGDCFDRYKCRIEEMRESVKIVEQALDAIRGGPVNLKLPPMLRPAVTTSTGPWRAPGANSASTWFPTAVFGPGG